MSFSNGINKPVKSTEIDGGENRKNAENAEWKDPFDGFEGFESGNIQVPQQGGAIEPIRHKRVRMPTSGDSRKGRHKEKGKKKKQEVDESRQNISHRRRRKPQW